MNQMLASEFMTLGFAKNMNYEGMSDGMVSDVC